MMEKKMKTKKEAKEIARDLLEGAFTRIPAKYDNNYCQAISAETGIPVLPKGSASATNNNINTTNLIVLTT
jgi:hypothetical protein